MQADWELSHSFLSDGRGIRCCCVLPSSADHDGATAYRLVAGTQGGALWEFAVPSGDMTPVDYQHDHDVTAILSNNNHGVYVTGCKDAIIRIFSHSHQFLAELKGHDKPVTSLSWVGDNHLISGSWDGTARVWDITTRAILATLDGHENTVSVAGISMEGPILHIATGSAGIAQNNSISNHAIRIWTVNTMTGEKQIVNKVANDHDGPIRALCIDSNAMLASCSNDGTVKLRSIETGECLSTLAFMMQDPPMLLSVTGVGTDMLAASAEDGHVIVWTGQDSHLIRHATSVWNVMSLPDDDLATCCQDGTLRIFTQSTDRLASDSVRKDFAETVAAAIDKQKKGPSQDEVAKLPKWELNALQHGKSEGQVQLFQKEGRAIAAQWSMASQTWIEVGEVVGSNEAAGMIDGVKYDHVLPIEVDQTGGGVAKLQIGYNTGENPFVAAQRFIDAHMMPQHYLAEIADYISQRVGHSAPTIGMDAGPSTVVPPVAYEHLPMKSYKCFELTKATSFEKMLSKLKDSDKLSDGDFEALQALTSTLSVTNRYHATLVPQEQLKAIKGILENWPPEEAFPALDLARLAVLHPDGARNGTYWDSLIKLTLQQGAIELKGTAAVAVPMLTIRLFANCYKGGAGAMEAAVANMDIILDYTEKYLKSTNKNIRLSVATLLVNIATYLKAHPGGPIVSHHIVSQVNIILETKLYDGEAMIRSLVALGTVLLTGPEAKAAAKVLGMVGKVEMMASPHGEKAKSVAREIYIIINR